jgi:SET domain-containing protein
MHHHTQLFEIDDYVVIDASIDGYVARFFNHSCDPI